MTLGRGLSQWTESRLAAPTDYHIPSRPTLDQDATSRLKHGDTFGVFDHTGDILAFAGNSDGLYHHDTRHLSHYELRINGAKPLLLSSSLENDNAALIVDLTNPEFADHRFALDKDMIHIHRHKFLWQAAMHERIEVTNFDVIPHDLRLSLVFAADFADLFEARGQRRAARGRSRAEKTGGGSVLMAYLGLDDQIRETVLSISPRPKTLDENAATFCLSLPANGSDVIFIRVSCGDVPADPPWSGRAFFAAMRRSRRALRAGIGRATQISTSSSRFDELIQRARADLTMLITDKPEGPYPYAGVPWFSTAFGRDAIITALFTCWCDPAIARGVLGFLAATQAKETDDFRDSEPGKILHEMRQGEMAAMGEVPFGLYYGSVDATPLFVVLAGAYLERTGDLEFLSGLWPEIRAALRWIDDYGDIDGDGFVEYAARRESGLVNQGWKDSHDSIFHADGEMAEGPIALCEVQSYVYGAWKAGAGIARGLGRMQDAERFEGKADRLKRSFAAAYWLEDLRTYALALDGRKRPCRVVTSNAGHTLLCGLAEPAHASTVIETLLRPDAFSGWGIRTLARGEVRFNPMAYHNGSVWPHDNAVIALGCARYGLKLPILRIFEGLTEAASYFRLQRLPELFCGFPKAMRHGPTAYPVACAPQAWAAASSFALLAALLGITFRHDNRELCLEQPALPGFLDRLTLRDLNFGEARVDLSITRVGSDIAVAVLERTGDLKITVLH